MLMDIIVTVMILLGGVVIYFALMGLIVFYNKHSTGSLAAKTKQAEHEETLLTPKSRRNAFSGLKVKLTAFRLKQPRRGDDKPASSDPLKQQHKKYEEEFRRKMQQRDEDLLRELRQRREEKRNAEQPSDIAEPSHEPSTV